MKLFGFIRRKKLTIVLLIIAAIFALTGCGNSATLSDSFSNKTNTFRYILTNEAGEYHLHEVEKWMDSASDALGVITTCCNNRFWTSYNEAVLYTNEPEYLPDYVIICDWKEEKL